METHLPNKFLHAHQKSHVTLRYEYEISWLTSGPISFTAYISCYCHSEMPGESLTSKYFCIIILHDSVPKQLASTSESNDCIYCVSSARSETQVIYIIYENYYIQWLLLYS